METDGFAWDKSAGERESQGNNEELPKETPVPREKKPFRLVPLLITLVLFLVLMASIIAAFPSNPPPRYYPLSFSTPDPDTILFSGQIDLSGAIAGFSVEDGSSQIFGFDKLLLTGPMGTQVFTSTDLLITGGRVILRSDTNLDIVDISGFIMIMSTWEGENRTAITFFTVDKVHLEGQTSLIATENSSVIIDNQVYRGDFILQLEGIYQSVHMGRTMGLATNGTMDVTVQESSQPLYFEDLVDRVLEAKQDSDLNVPYLPMEARNIALFTTGDTIIEGHILNYSYFCFSRGTYTASVGDFVSIDGLCTLVLTDNGFYLQDTSYPLLPFLPKKLIGFWPIALGIWVITRFLIPKKKRYVRSYEKQGKKSLKIMAVFFHLLLFLVALYLWDHEIDTLLGRSVFTYISSKGLAAFSFATSNPLLLLIPFEFIPWLVGLLLIGLPLSISINSILHIWSFHPGGRGIGKGIGDLGIWLLGSVYILFFLNLFISPLLTTVIKHLGW